MNKKSIGIIVSVVVLLVVAAGAYALVMAGQSEAELKQSNVTTNNAAPVEKSQSVEYAEAPSDSSAGSYVDYSDSAIDDADGTILLFFYAPWCPQCRSVDASIVKDGVPSGVTVIKTDYDTHQDLRQKYGVTLQTTFVKVDSSGKKLASYVAYQEPTFESVKKALLP